MWLARAGDRIGDAAPTGDAHHGGDRADGSDTGADTAYGDLCDASGLDLSLASR